jgi:hypothetical protein
MSTPFVPLSFAAPQIPAALQALNPPPSQKAGDCPISFTLDSTLTGSTKELVVLPLNIRPEELTRTEVSRTSVQQTLGGAFADDFGAGLTQINISGNTGWRGFNGVDGTTYFKTLRDVSFTKWHTLRNMLVQKGYDPSSIKLIFSDALNSTVDEVIPVSFTLRRSRSRPLVCMYQISMIAIGDPPPSSSSSSGGFLSGLVQSLGLQSIVAAIGQIVSAVKAAVNFVESDIIGPITSFMNMACAVFNEAVAIVETPAALVSLVTGVAQSVAQCGFNMFATLGSVASNAANVTGSLMQVQAAFSDVACAFANAIAQAQTYPVYTGLYGASNCSSTVPGSSPQSQYTLNGSNPFYDVMGTNTPPPIQVSLAAQEAINTILNTDPVLSPLTPAQLATLATTITNGISVT